MMQKNLVSWRDIPSYVMVKKGRAKGKAMLSHRFQHAIDRAAMRSKKGGSDDYMDEWHREALAYEGEGDLQTIADQQAQLVEDAYSDEELAQLAKNHGRQRASKHGR